MRRQAFSIFARRQSTLEAQRSILHMNRNAKQLVFKPEINFSMFDSNVIDILSKTLRNNNARILDSNPLAKMTWDFTNYGHGQSAQSLLEKIARQIIRSNLNGFSHKDLVQLIFVFAELNFDHDVFDFFAHHIFTNDIIRQLNPNDTAIVLYSFAKVGRKGDILFKQTLNAFRNRNYNWNDLSFHSISKTLWAYAKIGIINRQFFETGSKAVQRLSISRSDIVAQNIVNTLSAFSIAGIIDPGLFSYCSTAIQERRLFAELSPKEYISVIFSFLKAKVFDERLFTVLSNAIIDRKILKIFKPTEIYSLVDIASLHYDPLWKPLLQSAQNVILKGKILGKGKNDLGLVEIVKILRTFTSYELKDHQEELYIYARNVIMSEKMIQKHIKNPESALTPSSVSYLLNALSVQNPSPLESNTPDNRRIAFLRSVCNLITSSKILHVADSDEFISILERLDELQLLNQKMMINARTAILNRTFIISFSSDHLYSFISLAKKTGVNVEKCLLKRITESLDVDKDDLRLLACKISDVFDKRAKI